MLAVFKQEPQFFKKSKFSFTKKKKTKKTKQQQRGLSREPLNPSRNSMKKKRIEKTLDIKNNRSAKNFLLSKSICHDIFLPMNMMK